MMNIIHSEEMRKEVSKLMTFHLHTCTHTEDLQKKTKHGGNIVITQSLILNRTHPFHLQLIIITNQNITKCQTIITSSVYKTEEFNYMYKQSLNTVVKFTTNKLLPSCSHLLLKNRMFLQVDSSARIMYPNATVTPGRRCSPLPDITQKIKIILKKYALKTPMSQIYHD